jgi:hypothetical protein
MAPRNNPVLFWFRQDLRRITYPHKQKFNLKGGYVPGRMKLPDENIDTSWETGADALKKAGSCRVKFTPAAGRFKNKPRSRARSAGHCTGGMRI